VSKTSVRQQRAVHKKWRGCFKLTYLGNVDSEAVSNKPLLMHKRCVQGFFMRVALTIFMLMLLTKGYGQVTLGTGIVTIDFDDRTVIDFYKKSTDKNHYKRIEFFDDKEINSWNIRNLEIERTWLNPEVLWLDYSQFNFRCKSATANWLELIVNNDNGMTLWVKRTKTTTYLTWEEYLKNASQVDRLEEFKQKIRERPNDKSAEIEYEGRDCFEVRSMQGDWIEIFTSDTCDEEGTTTKVKSGWIRWREGEKLLIYYYTSC
jgi:hypothetical protein